MKESILKIEDERVIGKSCSRLITLTTNKCPDITLSYNALILLDLKAMGNSFQIVIKHRRQPNTWVKCVKCSQMMMKFVLNGSGRSTIHWKWKYSGDNTTNTVCRTQDMQWWAQRVGACKCFKLHPHAGASLQWRLPYARKKARPCTIQIQILLEHKYTT